MLLQSFDNSEQSNLFEGSGGLIIGSIEPVSLNLLSEISTCLSEEL